MGLALSGLATSAAMAGPTGDITVDYDCDAGAWVITSEKNLSNIVVGDDGMESKTELSDMRLYTYIVSDPDATLDTIWVKAGNNKSGDGPGYGERFDLGDTGCDPDADGDGYPASQDCNDNDPTINPGAVEIPNDDIDQNCDGVDLIVGDGELRFTLIWDSSDDLDLHVIDPSGERIWYQDRESASGGVLDRDDNVGACLSDPEPGGVENVFWPVGGAPTGTYTIEIDNYNDCDDDNLGTWTLNVYQDGELLDSYTGGEGDTIGAATSGEFKVVSVTHVQP
ncbi:MopE-related protein [Ornithinimicrobium sp. LYQ121]|uniref:MopE-related protein n=1 Tax=Ornithinimicrobium sp. LYQ121 TaxID=3378801 RepID=UPI003852F1EB